MSVLNLKYPVSLLFFGSQNSKFNFILDLSDSFLNNTSEDIADASNTNTAQYFNQDYTIPSLENEPLDTGFSGASRATLAHIGIGFNPFI